MTKKEKLEHYSKGNVTVGTISQIVEGDFVKYFVGKVRGVIVSNGDKYKFSNEEDARINAISFRGRCRFDLKHKNF